MELRLKHKKEVIVLANQPFAGGGEGNLYKIKSPKGWGGYVAKIYHPKKLTRIREQKINFLIEYPPVQNIKNEYDHSSIIWAKDALYNSKGEFVGFVMPYINGEKLEILCTPKIPRKLRKSWQRFDFSKGRDALGMRMKLSFNICAAIHQIHESKVYVLVDMKPDNILIQPDGLVSVVDTDSVAVIKDGKSFYEAPVATPEYTPPEYYRKMAIEPTTQQAWDHFGLGVILYKLFFGVHPFAASSHAPYEGLVTLDDKIKAGLFVHDPSKKKSFKIIPPPHLAFAKLDPILQDMFIKCFVDGGYNPELRPTAEEWCTALLFVIDDTAALQRYGNILGLDTNRRFPKVVFPLPSAIVSIPSTSNRAFVGMMKMMEKQSDLRVGKIPIKTKDLHGFKDSKWGIGGYVTVVFLLLLGIFIINSFLIGCIFIFLLFRIKYKNRPIVVQKKKAKKRLRREERKLRKKQQNFFVAQSNYKKIVGSLFIDLKELSNKIALEKKELEEYLLKKDKEVKQIQKIVNDYNRELKSKYLTLALQNKYIKRLGGSEIQTSIAKIKLELDRKYKRDLNRLSKGKDLSDKNPLFKDNRIAVDTIVNSSKIKIEELVAKKIEKIRDQKDDRVDAAQAKLEYAADIESHFQRLWKKRWYISENEKRQIKVRFEKMGLYSILQIKRIDNEAKIIKLYTGEQLKFSKLWGSSKGMGKALFYWFDEIKHQKNAFDKINKIFVNQQKIKISDIEEQQRLEIRTLKVFEKKELEKVKVGVQKVILGQPFANMQQEYQMVTDYIVELEMAHKKEYQSTTSSYTEQYEKTIKEVEIKAEQANDKLKKINKKFKALEGGSDNDYVRKNYRELEWQLKKLKGAIAQLRQEKWEMNCYENITFINYIKNI